QGVSLPVVRQEPPQAGVTSPVRRFERAGSGELRSSSTAWGSMLIPAMVLQLRARLSDSRANETELALGLKMLRGDCSAPPERGSDDGPRDTDRFAGKD